MNRNESEQLQKHESALINIQADFLIIKKNLASLLDEKNILNTKHALDYSAFINTLMELQTTIKNLTNQVGQLNNRLDSIDCRLRKIEILFNKSVIEDEDKKVIEEIGIPMVY